MKKMLFSLAVMLIALASCAPSAMEIEKGSPAEAAQNFFTAIQEGDYTKAADWANLSAIPGASISTEYAAKAAVGIMKTLNATLGMTEVYAVSETVNGDEADVELYVNTESNGSGTIIATCKKVGDAWKCDIDFKAKE